MMDGLNPLSARILMKIDYARRRLRAFSTHTVLRHHFTCGIAFGAFREFLHDLILTHWHLKG